MSFRCKELGITNVSRQPSDFCPTASATISRDACGQATAPTTGGDVRSAIAIDFEPLRAQMREALRN